MLYHKKPVLIDIVDIDKILINQYQDQNQYQYKY